MLDERWLNLNALARVEMTSESAECPIESALLPDHGSGWRAAQPGKQTIRIIFDQPLSLGHIFLRFEEDKQERTQEFVLGMIRSRRPAVVPEDCASAVHFQSSQHHG